MYLYQNQYVMPLHTSDVNTYIFIDLFSGSEPLKLAVLFKS